MITLNVGAGNINPLRLYKNDKHDIVLNVDESYLNGTPMEHIDHDIKMNLNNSGTQLYLKGDIFEYLGATRTKFDRVVMYRFLEHISFTDVEYFIYLISRVLKKNGLVDVIVPDYTLLAGMILNEEYFQAVDPNFNFTSHNILLTTELLNEPNDPHASIWTPQRMKYFWELEGRFELLKQRSSFKFDGRDVYLRSVLKRVWTH